MQNHVICTLYAKSLPKNKVNRDEFWKKVDTLPFEKLHLRYMKIILGVHSPGGALPPIAIRGCAAL